MRDLIRSLPASKIREVANEAMARTDVLAFWFGESDETTAVDIREAAAASLAAGETFYSHNLGLAELRQAIGSYMTRLHGPVGMERVAVTSSGVSALMLAQQALLDAGDSVVAVVPLWPNLTAQATLLGAQVRRVSLRAQQGAWRLDLQQLLDAIVPGTRAVLVNAPNNPTGWTLQRHEQQRLLEHCRRTGTWIVADEVYERLYYGAQASDGTSCAPSFLDIAAPDDRLVVVHSFSKSFLMTGWRLGWMVAPGAVVAEMAKLIEFNTSCAPVFVQRAGLAALAGAHEQVPALVRHLRTCRDVLMQGLATVPGIETSVPVGGMYAFLRVHERNDSLVLAKHLVTHAGLGLAPGSAFGPEGEGWLRWCFASREASRLSEGVERLRRGLL